jgi:hypothetical protein
VGRGVWTRPGALDGRESSEVQRLISTWERMVYARAAVASPTDRLPSGDQ